MRQLLLSAAIAGLATAAQAGPTVILSPATVTQYVDAGVDGAPAVNHTATGLGPTSAAGVSPPGTIGAGDAQAGGSAMGTPSPLLTGVISASMNPATIPPKINTLSFETAADYSARLHYTLEVLGPTANVGVQIKAKSSLSTSTAPSNTIIETEQEFVLYYNDDFGNTKTVVYDQAWAAAGGHSANIGGDIVTGLSGGFSEAGIYTLMTDTPYTVSMSDLISVGVLAPGGSVTVSGSVDPTFRIAAGVPDPAAYSFVFSPGIGNGAAGGVPEPSTWAVLLLGMVGLGSVLRRQKRIASAACVL
jgi:hypothetical protein